jgi:GntP family gluconate:H+ symporter
LIRADCFPDDFVFHGSANETARRLPARMSPLLLLLLGMFIVVGGILGLRLHAFLALILGALTVALLTPETALRRYAEERAAKSEISTQAAARFPSRPAAARVAGEFGKTCTDLGLLIAMATLIGEGMLLSGAAEAIAATLLRWFGSARAHWAFFTASFVLCMPVMLDTVMYLLAPLFKAVARQTQRDYLLLVMCTVAGGTMTHSLVPPTPGPLVVAGELGVPFALMIGMGAVIGFGAALAGVAFAKWSNRRYLLEVPAEDAQPPPAERRLPPLWLALLPIILPIGLISCEASLLSALPANGWLPWLVKNLGDRNLALTLGALAALVPLAGRGEVAAKAVKTALGEGAVILLIIGAGGAFGGVLQQTGIAGQLAARFQGAHTLALPLVFLVTMLVRTAQGSATVAMITAAPIAKALLAGGTSLHPVYFALAIGCGSKPFSWMNDAGFWIITRVSGLREARTLCTVSPMMAIQGFVGLLLTILAAWLVPLAR